MSDDSDRQAKYAEIRERFLSDPEFRTQLRTDTVGTLTSVLGPLTDQEQQWIRDLPDESTSEEDLVDQVRSGRVGSW